MKKKFLMALILLGVMAMQAGANAGETVSIRLVEASNNGEASSKQLDDVSSILKSQLSYKTYKLIDQKSCGLPAKGTIKMQKGFELECIGKQDNFSITVHKSGNKLLQTTLDLKSGKPLILGGFPSGKNKLLLVLLAQ